MGYAGYNDKTIANHLLNLAKKNGWRVENNSFERELLHDETFHSVSVSRPDEGRAKDDYNSISAYLRPEKILLDINGFGFESDSVERQMKLIDLLFKSEIKVRRYQKKRLNPFKINIVFEQILKHNNKQIVLTRWDSELKNGLKTEDLLAQLGS